MYFSFVVFQCVNNFVVLQCALVVFQNLFVFQSIHLVLQWLSIPLLCCNVRLHLSCVAMYAIAFFKCLYLCCVECLSTFVVFQVNDESLNSSPSVAKFKAPAKSVLKQTRVRGTSGDIECM